MAASPNPAYTESGVFLLAAMQATFLQTTVNQLLLNNGDQVADDVVHHQAQTGTTGKNTVKMTGIKVMIFCCIGSVTVVGDIFWMKNMVAPMMIGRM